MGEIIEIRGKENFQRRELGARQSGRQVEEKEGGETSGAEKRVNPLGSPQPPGVILLDDKTGVRGQVLLTPLISSALHAAEYRAQKRELSKYPGWLRPLRQKERRSIPAQGHINRDVLFVLLLVRRFESFLSNISPVCTWYVYSCHIYIYIHPRGCVAKSRRNSKDLALLVEELSEEIYIYIGECIKLYKFTVSP